MLDRWLRAEKRESFAPSLDVRRVTADPAAEDEELEAWLGHELMRNYISPAKRACLVAVFRDLGIPDLASHIEKTVLPSDDIVRIGEFGEALTGVIFRRTRRYCLPVLKLRHKHRPNAPVQGADLLAFRLSANPPIVAVPEVKTRSTKNLNVGKEAHTSLAGALSTLTSSIDFVATRLLEHGNQALGSRIMALLADDTKVVERHIVVVHEDDIWDERILERLGDVVTEQTEATVIRLKGLRARIRSTYAAAARAVYPDARGAATTAHDEERNAGA